MGSNPWILFAFMGSTWDMFGKGLSAASPGQGWVPAMTMKAAGLTALHGGSVHIYITLHSSKILTLLSSWTKAKHLSRALYPHNVSAKGVWGQAWPAVGCTCIPNSMYHVREETCSRIMNWAHSLAVQVSALPAILSRFYLLKLVIKKKKKSTIAWFAVETPFCGLLVVDGTVVYLACPKGTDYLHDAVKNNVIPSKCLM